MKRVEKSRSESAGKKNRLRPFLHLDDLFAHYARTAPDRVAIVAPGHGAVSYSALRLQVDEVVRALRNLGVGRRDRVAVVLPDGAEAAVAIIAAATAAICLPLSPAFTADEWQRYFSALGITALLTRADIDSPCRGIAHSNGVLVIDLSPQLDDGSPCAFCLVGSGTSRADGGDLSPGADDDAFMLLTSGTSSRPKLVPLTHAGICRSAYNAGAVLQLGPRDRLLNVLPLFHAHGLISGLLTALAAGSTVVCAPGFDADTFFGWLTEFQPTWYTAVPTIHRAVLSAAGRHRQ